MSALRCATSSCERLALRYQRHLGTAQIELRSAGQDVVGQSGPDQFLPEHGYDRGNQIRHRAIASRWRLEAWLTDELRPWFSDRLLDVNEDVLVIWRRLVEQGKEMRHTFPQPDLFIAATAILHDLCVVTRNTGDFLRTGVSLLNPWVDSDPRQAE